MDSKVGYSSGTDRFPPHVPDDTGDDPWVVLLLWLLLLAAVAFTLEGKVVESCEVAMVPQPGAVSPPNTCTCNTEKPPCDAGGTVPT